MLRTKNSLQTHGHENWARKCVQKHFRSLAQFWATKINAAPRGNAMRWGQSLVFLSLLFSRLFVAGLACSHVLHERQVCCNLMYWLHLLLECTVNWTKLKCSLSPALCFVFVFNRLMINIVTSGWMPHEWNCNGFGVLFISFLLASSIQSDRNSIGIEILYGAIRYAPLANTHFEYLAVTISFPFTNVNENHAGP